MAAIDKIYVDTWEEYLQFRSWCKQQPLLEDKYGKKVRITDYLYNYEEPWINGQAIFNAPCYVDAYVIRNCPFDFIQKELMVNYGHWSQERIKQFYENIENWDSNQGKSPYWAKLEDFIILEDGTMTIKGLEKSAYSKIKKGELYSYPIANIKYIIGKHFKCIKHPAHLYNTPSNYKNWIVNVEIPKEINSYMWYHKDTNTWDFIEDFVNAEWSSSCAHCKTIRALKRLIIKWKLPVGSTIEVSGRPGDDGYTFIVKK